MKTQKQLNVEYEGIPVEVNLLVHREMDSGLDSVLISWWVKSSEFGELYFSKNYEFSSFNEASRFLIDYSGLSAQDLVGTITSI